MTLQALSWILSCWSLGTMWLMSAGRYKPAWIGSLIGNVGWIYLSFASDLPGMSFYSIVMLGIASRGLYKAVKDNAPSSNVP